MMYLCIYLLRWGIIRQICLFIDVFDIEHYKIKYGKINIGDYVREA